ncbi:MAG: SIMPL domain-containing protein [Leptolyngbyaceae cyanobacterium bins.349]|nr:SIMPL domain-containing protein [Leptolyngbyaceae cyanobacterium bins.349]
MQQWKFWTAVVMGVSLLGIGLTYPAIAQEKMPRTLTVTGRGTELIPTTLTQVRLGVEAQGKTANEVQQEVARRSNSVVSLLRSRNVTRLETTGINLSPNYRYDNNVQTLIGYNGSNMVSFRVETAKAGDILDDAVKAGASRIDGVSFVAADAAIADARKVALREATQDAQAQADAVLAALGLTRREVIGIQVNGAFTPPPRPFAMNAKFGEAQMADAAPSPVVGGEQQVEASVTLQITY